jgi:phosphatidylglycerophosphate synthase
MPRESFPVTLPNTLTLVRIALIPVFVLTYIFFTDEGRKARCLSTAATLNNTFSILRSCTTITWSRKGVTTAVVGT